jgi:hypothetical protein
MFDRKMLATLIPLVAITIALAEFLYDHTEPRWHSPTFWAGLIATVGLLVLVQAMRFSGKSNARPASKPDYSATSIIRRSVDRGNE